MKQCEAPNCNNYLEGRHPTAKYCNRKCKRIAQEIRNAQNLGEIPGASTVALPQFATGADVATQYVITSQNDNIRKLEQQIIELRAEKKEYKNKYETAKEEFKDYKIDTEKAELQREFEKPSGLAGIAEQAKEFGFGADHIMELIKMFPGMAAKMVPKGLPQAVNDSNAEVLQWISQLDDEFSQYIMALITPISQVATNDREAAKNLITELLKNIPNGTSTTTSEGYAQTA